MKRIDHVYIVFQLYMYIHIFNFGQCRAFCPFRPTVRYRHLQYFLFYINRHPDFIQETLTLIRLTIPTSNFLFLSITLILARPLVVKRQYTSQSHKCRYYHRFNKIELSSFYLSFFHYIVTLMSYTITYKLLFKIHTFKKEHKRLYIFTFI